MIKQRIRDPLHNLIEFNDTEIERVLWKVIQSRPFQRLRRIKQLGFSELVYPGAGHTRFAHSIGVFHTARQLMGVVRKNTTERAESREHRALAAALVHDLGHGPFSHAFEEVGRKLKLKLAHHEAVSDLLIRDTEISEIFNTELGSGFASDVADIVKQQGKITIHNSVVSSQFDADRLDYMRRDRLMSGTEHSAIDFTWLIANLEIATLKTGTDEQESGKVETFVIGPKAIQAAEAYILGLFQLYPTVYFHKTTRGVEKIFTSLLVRVIELAMDERISETGLPLQHPIIKFSLNPESLENALSIDDTVIWGSLSMMMDAKDPLIREFSKRIRDRNIYKCIDIRSKVTHLVENELSNHDKAERKSESLIKIERICATVSEKLGAWSCDESDKMPRVLLDEGKRSPYKDEQGILGRINVKTDGGNFVDLKQCSQVVANIPDFKLNRVYFSQDDSTAQQKIEQIIKDEVKS